MTQTPSQYERKDGDCYFTPAWVTEALLQVESFEGPTIDPAAGGWHMVEAMRAGGVLCDGFDIAPEPAPGGHVTGPFSTQDFLTFDGMSTFGTPYVNYCSNPPYGKGGRLAVRFVEHALELARPHRGKVAMLLRVDFDSANGRRHIFADHPAFAARHILTRRIRWANLEQSKAGPTENHCWMVWDWGKRPDAAPTITYLPKPSSEATDGHTPELEIDHA